ncbi:REP-associated tyrosine transposase [Zobellella denitrificans]|uniref:REP-associated tyrosine transposase n=1 Tax=Zobellella denitrificans TaxID=347534 RepID=UPI0034A0CC6C
MSSPSPCFTMTRDKLLAGRCSLPGYCYHITICTHRRRPWFGSFEHARIVVQDMKRLHQEQLMMSVAWVLMPDHLHWLFQLGENTELSLVVKLLKGRTAKHLNELRHDQGHVWQKGFHDHAVRKDEDLRGIARYIVANPLRAGLVKRVGDYPWWDAMWL